MSDKARETKLQAAKQLLKLTLQEWWNDDTFRFAASLAFYTIFSLAPVLLIAIGVASFFLGNDAASAGIITEVQKMVGSEGAQAVQQIIAASKGFGNSAWTIGIGIGTFLFGSTVVFAELQATLNKIWDVQADPKRGFIAKLIADRLRSFSLALGVGFLLLISLVISAVISGVQKYMTNWMPGVPLLWQALNVIASFVIAALLFAMIYKYLPDVKISWRDVRIGSFVTAALFTVGKYLIGLYLGQTAVASAFGAAGSFVVLIVWIYYSALISFFGAEFTQVFARRYGSRIHPEEYAERVGEKSDTL
ncbi:YihY/virulence factor BrkB family protein [Verrucomicrobiota bacterium sgz303538]